jgi:TonB-linked SusC/RagA family outer membrane protein
MIMTKKTLGVSNVLLFNLKMLKVLCVLCFSLFSFQSIAVPNLPEKPVRLSDESPGAGFTSTNEKSYETTNDFYVPADTTIRGRILDSAGSPLSGVTVMIRGTRRGTVTDASGNFTLNSVPEGSTIVISNVGYETQEVRLSRGQTSLSVNMNYEAGTLTDVVVTGFQRINKKNFTGAAVTLKAEEVRIPGVTDVSRMLEGRAAGLSIQNVSSTFGSAPKIRIRGATSINGDNKPLWVIDGVVLEDIINISNDQLSSGDPTTLLGSSVAGINSNDIESIDILKDAAATALYGARAMNGVIVVTTKKGRSGKPVISYTGNFSTQLKPTYNSYNIMNSVEQMSVLAEIERKGYLNSDILSAGNFGVYGKMYEQLNADASGNFPLQNTPEAKNAFLRRYALANTDWFDELFQNSLIQEHSLSISTGSERSQSFFSTSFYNDNGWTIADDVKRYTLNFRNNYTISDKLNVGFLTQGSVRQQHAPGTVTRVSNPVAGQFDRDFDINPFSYALNTSRAMTLYDENGQREFFRRNFAPFNILTELENNTIDLNVMDFKLQGELGYKIMKNLTYEFIGALRYVKSSREHKVTENANMANAYRAADNATIKANNPFLYSDPDNPDAEPVVVLPSGGFYNRTEDQLTSFDVRNSLNYVNTIKEKHSINILAGQQIKYADRQNFNSRGYGYQYESGGTVFVDYRALKQTIEQNFPYYGMSQDYDRFAAFYLNAQYTYDRRYNLYGTVRYDGSNRLGSSPSARWLPTWSFGGAWNIDEESFMQNVDIVDNLKLRASYGLTASMGPATNSQIVLRNINTNRPAGEVESVIQLANLENSELTWEKNYTTNVGIDAGLFERRLTMSVDAYMRKSFDLISVIKTSGIGGEQFKAANYADMDSKGIEFSLGGQILRSRDWGWRANATFGYNQTLITNVKNNPDIFSLVKAEGGNKEGYAANSLFSIRFSGLNHINGIPEFINEKGSVAYAVYLQDDSTQYLKHEGSIDPTITGGFSNTFNWKAFSLNIFITYQAGNKIRLYPAFNSTYSEQDAMPREFLDRWIQPGDELQTNVPSIMGAFENSRIGGDFPYNNYNYSTERVADGGFVRLKTVSLTYTLPQTMVDGTGILKNASLMVSAINPWLIYSDPKLKGQDPEFFNAGGVAQPIQKQFALSLRVGF